MRTLSRFVALPVTPWELKKKILKKILTGLEFNALSSKNIAIAVSFSV
jgi:hypothetical protein